MSSITIRNFDDDLKASLRLRAARHGVSMEQEVRNILQSALAAEASPASGLALAMRIHQRFQGLDAEGMAPLQRTPARAVPDLG